MNTRSWLFVLVIGALPGCHHSSSSADYLRLVERLERSSALIEDAGEIDYHALLQKQARPETQEKVDYWMPMVKQLRTYTGHLCTSIAHLKDALKKSERADLPDSSVDSLFHRLSGYPDTLYVLIPNSADRHMLLDDFDALVEWKGRDKASFRNRVSEGGQGYLAMLQNDLRTLESRILHFMNKRIGSFVDDYTVNTAFTGQNTKYVKQGELIEVYAALLAVSSNSMPVIHIAGRHVPLSPEGVAIYRSQVTGKTGQHTLPVVYTFISPDGRKDTITRTVTFTVIK